ncbi:MAG: amidohydrolase family protein [Polyangiales bacterium]
MPARAHRRARRGARGALARWAVRRRGRRGARGLARRGERRSPGVGERRGVRAMAEAGVVGVLLPGAAFSLGQPMPDARRLRGLGLAVALATDCNPGTSHTESLPLMAAFAVRQMGMTTVEAWHAVTRVAADALRLHDRGRLTVGARADVAVMDFESWECLPYDFGGARAWAVARGGG